MMGDIDQGINWHSMVQRRCHKGCEPTSMSEIYCDDVNISIWQRSLDASVAAAAKRVICMRPHLQVVAVVTPDSVSRVLDQELGSYSGASHLCEDISKLVDMFCYLFDLQQAGLRLKVLDDAMCPRFHVDQLPCRLITTYHGETTQWLPNQRVDRSKLGLGCEGKQDKDSGIYQSEADIQQLDCGDVALLKGESWVRNTGGGVVHRSPQPAPGSQRLLMTLDFLDRYVE